MGWTRTEHLGRLDGSAVDVVVIGGGIVGAGTALDLASRGATVAVLEQTDFASGTSGKSTKLFHGGIRYLPQFRFGLVREGLREQRILAETADYLYQPLNFVIPLYRGVSFGDLPSLFGHHRVVPLALRLGLILYDTWGRRSDRHRKVDAAEARELAPALKADGLKGAFVYGDAQTEDARLTVAVAKAAVAHGAIGVNHLQVDGVARDGDGYRVSATDLIDGAEVSLRAKAVVAAAGFFRPPHPEANQPLELRYSRGSHIITPIDDVGLTDHAVVVPETEDERILYMIPWYGHGLVGTTDVESDGDGGHPVASPEEVDYLVRHVARFTGRSPRAMTTFAGVRALAAAKGSSAKASRKEKVTEIAPGFFQVAGGKLTGYRHISEDIANAAAKAIRLDKKSTTRSVPISGAGGPPGSGRLWERYGTDAAAVTAIAAEEPRFEAAFADGTLAAEVVHGARHEGAATIGDITLRRTRLSWFTDDHGRTAAPDIARLLGDELGWDAGRQAGELEAFEAQLKLEGL